MRMLFILLSLVFSGACVLGADDSAKGLIIVTTNTIKENSQKLSTFVRHKEIRGFKVLVATEDQYGGTGVKGQPKAILIREWLKKVYKDYSFVLLIGYPHSDYGDVPMLKFWSRKGEQLLTGMNEFADTDFFYADMTGNWDINGNGDYGEKEDWGKDGVDFNAELAVGRMAVYFDDMNMLDSMLQHNIDYMNHTKEFSAYRKKILFPAAIFGFKGMPFIGAPWPFDEDSAQLMEWFAKNYLTSRPEISITRMYEQDGIQPSAYKSDIPLNTENIISEWNKGYGMIMWGAHGAPSAVSRVVWDNDNNGNTNPDEGEVLWPTMFDYQAAGSLSGKYPGFAVAVSCDVGQSQQPNNLVSHLLISGGVVGMVASTVAGPRSIMYWHDLDSELDTTTFGDDNVGPLFLKGLIEGGYAGNVVADIKKSAGSAGDIETMTGKASFNYYGDPTLRLESTNEDILPDMEIPDNAAAASDDDIKVNPDEANSGSSGGCSIVIN